MHSDTLHLLMLQFPNACKIIGLKNRGKAFECYNITTGTATIKLNNHI